MLLSPLTASGKAKRLLIVTEGLLQYVPFAALPFAALPSPQITQPARSNDTAGLAGKSVLNASSLLPLISQYEIVSLPSASTLAVLRREFAGRKQAARALAVLADPVFDKEDSRVDMNPQGAGIRGARQQPRTRSPAPEKIPGEVESPVRPSALDSLGQIPRLPFTRQEAIYASSFIPESDRKIALDFDASRATVMSGELSQYRIVHFATHGLLNSEQPELSGIVFSLVDKQGAPQNGFLRLNEIYNLNLPAELVILSACQTGLGKEIKGEGLVGLTRGFMYSGAARVLASLWRVDDKATAELMKHFYQAMLGKERLPAAAALRAAQLALWKQKRWQAPYYWAGFVLQGEWR
jgi:CHAT domain-containing protein